MSHACSLIEYAFQIELWVPSLGTSSLVLPVQPLASDRILVCSGRVRLLSTQFASPVTSAIISPVFLQHPKQILSLFDIHASFIGELLACSSKELIPSRQRWLRSE